MEEVAFEEKKTHSRHASATNTKPRPPSYVPPERDKFGRLVGGRYAPKHTRRKSRTVHGGEEDGMDMLGLPGTHSPAKKGHKGHSRRRSSTAAIAEEGRAEEGKGKGKGKGKAEGGGEEEKKKGKGKEKGAEKTGTAAVPGGAKGELNAGDYIRMGAAGLMCAFNVVLFVTSAIVLQANYDDPCDKKINIGLALLATWFGMLAVTSTGVCFARFMAVRAKKKLAGTQVAEVRMTAKVYHTACLLATAAVAASMVLVAGISSIFVFTSSESKCDKGLYNAGYYFTLIAFAQAGFWILVGGCIFCFHFFDTI